MGFDLAGLKITVDSKQVADATTALNGLAAAAKNAEEATKKHGAGQRKTATEINQALVQQSRDYQEYTSKVKTASTAQREHERRTLQFITADKKLSLMEQGREYQTYISKISAQNAQRVLMERRDMQERDARWAREKQIMQQEIAMGEAIIAIRKRQLVQQGLTRVPDASLFSGVPIAPPTQDAYTLAGVKSPTQRAAEIKNVTAAMAQLRAEHAQGITTGTVYTQTMHALTGKMNLLEQGSSRARSEFRRMASYLASATFEITGMVYGLATLGAALAAPGLVGIKLQKSMEDAQAAITGILVSMGKIDGRTMTVGESWKVAGAYIKEVHADAMRLGIDMDKLVNVNRAVMAPGLAVGLELQKIKQLATEGAIAVSMIGLNSTQYVQEIRDLIAGGIQPASSTLATALGITDKILKDWKAQGPDVFFDKLHAAIGGFAKAAEELRRSTLGGAWEILMARFSNLMTNSEAYSGLVKAVNSVADAMARPDFAAAIDHYWNFLKGIGAVIGDFIGFLYENRKAVLLLTEAYIGLKIASLGLMAFSKMSEWLMSMATSATAAALSMRGKAVATIADTAATVSNTAATVGLVDANGVLIASNVAVAGSANTAGTAVAAMQAKILTTVGFLGRAAAGFARGGLIGLFLWGIYEAADFFGIIDTIFRNTEQRMDKFREKLESMSKKSLLVEIEQAKRDMNSSMPSARELIGLDKPGTSRAEAATRLNEATEAYKKLLVVEYEGKELMDRVTSAQTKQKDSASKLRDSINALITEQTALNDVEQINLRTEQAVIDMQHKSGAMTDERHASLTNEIKLREALNRQIDAGIKYAFMASAPKGTFTQTAVAKAYAELQEKAALAEAASVTGAARSEAALSKHEAAVRKVTSAMTEAGTAAYQEAEAQLENGKNANLTAEAYIRIAEAKLINKGITLTESDKELIAIAAHAKAAGLAYKTISDIHAEATTDIQNLEAESVLMFAQSEQQKIQIKANAELKKLDLARARMEAEHAMQMATWETSLDGGVDEYIALQNRQTKETEAGEDARAKVIERAGKATRNVQLKDWVETINSIEGKFKEGFMSMFESGIDGWGKMIKSFKDMFKNILLEYIYKSLAKPFVLNVIASVTGAVGMTGMANAATQMAGGSGGMGGASNLFSMGSNIFGGGLQAGINTAAYSAFGGMGAEQAAMLAAQDAVFGVEGIAATLEAAGATTAASLATALPYIGLALGALALFGGDLFGGKEKPPVMGIANTQRGLFPENDALADAGGANARVSPFGTLIMMGQHMGETEEEINKLAAQFLDPIVTLDQTLANMLSETELESVQETLRDWRTGEFTPDQANINRFLTERLDLITDAVGGWANDLADTATGNLETVYGQVATILALREHEGAQTIAEALLADVEATSETVTRQVQRQILVAQEWDGVSETIAEEWQTVTETVTETIAGASSEFQREGETLATTFIRLISDLTVVNDAFDLMGRAALDFTLDAASMASDIMDAFGGRDIFKQQFGVYYEQFYTEEERLAAHTERVAEQFADLNLTMPDTHSGFRDLVDGLDLTTESGQELFASLIGLAPAFDSIADAAEQAAADAANAAEQAAADLAGIIEQSAASRRSLADQYRTESQRAAMAQYRLEQGFAAFNLSAPQTAQQFLDIVKSTDAATESGRELIAALEGLSGEFDIVQQYAQSVAESAFASLEQSVNAQIDGINAGVDAQIASMESAAEAQQEVYESQIENYKTQAQAARDLVQELETIYRALIETEKNLRPMSVAEGQEFIRDALIVARTTGALPESEPLQDALNAVKQITTADYRTAVDFARDKALTANAINDLGGIVGAQLDAARTSEDYLDDLLEETERMRDDINDSTQDQIDAIRSAADDQIERLQLLVTSAREQIDAINGLNAPLLSIADALNGFNAAIVQLASSMGVAAPTPITPGGALIPTTLPSVTVPPSVSESPEDWFSTYATGFTPASDAIPFWSERIAEIGAAAALTQFLAPTNLAAPRLSTMVNDPDYIAARDLLGLPEYAIGTNAVPYDMNARIHAGEKITPRPYVDIERAAREETNALLTKLQEEVRQMREENKSGQIAIARNTNRSAKVLEQFDGDGMPAERVI